MRKAFVIDIPLYNRDLLVVFGDRGYLVNQISEAYNIPLQSAYSITEDIDDYSTGRYYFNIEKGKRFLWMAKVPEKPQEYATLSHEIFHAAFGIMDEIGVSPSEDSEEAYAYLIGLTVLMNRSLRMALCVLLGAIATVVGSTIGTIIFFGILCHD